MIVAQDEPQDSRLKHIKQLYDYFSTFKINLPTPILAGVRTKIRQFSSCILIDCDDSLDSIFTSAAIAGKYTARRAGIGINMGRIRPMGSKIRHGEVIHTGIIPYMKVMESAVKSTSQNGIRGGSATVSVPWWHYEIEDVMQLKNNGGTDDNRVRKLDYCIQFDKVFYKALVTDDYVYLFSSDECPELYEAFGTPEFEEIYESCTRKRSLQFKKKIKASTLAAIFARERLETGRVYSMNIDHCNQGGCWDAPVKMTNLCVEITQPTIPSQTEFDEEGRIGVCTLGAINVLEIKDNEEMKTACSLLVRTLDFIIEYQDYPFVGSKNFAQRTRSLGIGVTNLAAWFACNKMSYNDEDAPRKAAELMESVQFYCLMASAELASVKGKCEDFHLSKYSKGQLPIDWYNREIDNVIGADLHHDWEALRESIDRYGLRNCSISAQMPCESSSVIQNATNGIEPVRALLSFKKAKNGKLKQLVPKFARYRKYYDLAFTGVKNESIIKVSAAMQKWIDMAMSTNLYYNYDDYIGGVIPLSVIMQDHLKAYKLGIKNLYYANTPDGDNEPKSTCDAGGCTL
jgi:ribonucleoside-diphosphate reductase alpha chain